MLICINQEFSIKPEFYDKQICDVSRFCDFDDYRNKMIQYGFVLRRHCIFCEDFSRKTINFSAILAHETAINDSGSFDKLELTHSSIAKYCTQSTIRNFEILHDYSYCSHTQWESLYLSHNHVWGTPSILCGKCKGIVAPYRLGLTLPLYEKLFAWENQKDSIQALSSLVSDYEDWADNELKDENSKINKLESSLRNDLEEYIGCKVYGETFSY